MAQLETLLLTISILIIASILIARISNNIGVPVLLLFIGIGMLAGSEGPGGIYFDDPHLAKNIGIISLVFILFSGGLDTKWKIVEPVLWPALSLATVGVVITTITIAIFANWLIGIPLLHSLLLGAVVSSTDAAAVFSIIGARKLKLKGKLTPLLELESGSNDPMALFLTISLIEIIISKKYSGWELAGTFILEMGLGLVAGVIFGRAIAYIINKLKYPIEGFYPLFALASAFFVYSLTTLIHGSGFLAVYTAGIVVGNHNIVHKKNISRFFDGMAWVAQVIMFLSLGLLVFPSRLLLDFKAEILISLFLIFLARPIGVFISLIPFKFSIKEKIFVSWVGLRGAVPIILATFPLINGVEEAQWIFYVVFFIVLTSALLQGWTIPIMAKALKLDAPKDNLITSPSEFSDIEQTDRTLVKFKIPDTPAFKNKALVEIKELRSSLIVTVKRGDTYFVPSGGTILEKGDVIQALVENNKYKELSDLLNSNGKNEIQITTETDKTNHLK